MKYKKYSYIIVLILMIFIGINNTYADSTNKCYYQTSDKQTLLEYTISSSKFEILTRGSEAVNWAPNDPLINDGKGKNDSETGIYVNAITDGTCPEYIVYRRKTNAYLWIDSDGVWGFSSKSSAQNFLQKSNQVNKMTAWILSYKNEDGTKITEEEFYESYDEVVSGGPITGNDTNLETDTGGTKVSVGCNDLFGSKSDPNSIRYLVNEILEYPRIIVPILVILLGTIDFAKAVISSKEDGMKKAQSTFIKRVIIGVVIFFVPMIVDILMGFADIVWAGLGYSSCDI